MSGGRRGNWDPKDRDPAAWELEECAYSVVVVDGFERRAGGLVADAQVERLDLGPMGSLPIQF